VTPANRLTPEQDALFDERMRYWQNRLGLNDWRVERGSRKTSNMAQVKRYPVDRLAVYATGPFRNVPATPESIDSTARHEMLHVLLAELVHVVAQTEDGDLQMAAEHRVVNTLEKLLA
jgi:hypothetical protein